MRYKLQEIANVAAGQGAPQGDHNYCDYGIPFVKAGNLAELIAGADIGSIQKVNEEVAKKHRLKLFRKGSVLFAKSGMSCLKGFVYVLPSAAYVVSHLACVTPEKVNSKYLKYYFLFHKPNTLIKDKAYPSISLTDIANMVVQVPENNVVRNVVSTLEKVESLLALYKSQLQKLDELVKSRFMEMFVIGNPYPREALKKYITQVRGVSYKPVDLRTSLTKDSVLLLRANNISESRLNHDKVQYVSAGKVSKAQLITEGDIIMCGSSGSLEHVGKVALCSKSVEGETFGAFCKLIRAIGALHPEYIAAYFGTEEYRKIIMQLACGSNINNIKTEHIDDLQIPIPDDDAQQQFIVFYRQIDKSKFAVRQALDKTRQLFDSLMQEYFG